MRLVLSQALDGHPYEQSAGHVVKKFVRRQMIPCGTGVLEITVATSICSQKRQRRTQPMAKVVCLSTAYDTCIPHFCKRIACERISALIFIMRCRHEQDTERDRV